MHRLCALLLALTTAAAQAQVPVGGGPAQDPSQAPPSPGGMRTPRDEAAASGAGLRSPHDGAAANGAGLRSPHSGAAQGGAVAGISSCPDRAVQVELEQWKAALSAAPAGSPRQNQLILALGLPPLPQWRGLASDEVCAQPPTLRGVDVFRAPLSGAQPDDVVVQARFDQCAEEPQKANTLLRVQVLRPDGPGRFCRIGDELSVDQAFTDQPCLGKAQKLPRLLAFVNVTDWKRKSIQVKDQHGSCDGMERGARYETAYYDVIGGRLVEILRVPTYEASYTSPRPPLMEITRSIRLDGGFPRAVTVLEQTECHADEDGNRQEGCRAGSKELRYRLRGGRYEPAD